MFNRLGTMRIADRKFKVIDATLTGRIGHESPVEWFLEVVTKEARYEGETRAPRAYLERCPSNACSMGQFLASPIVIESGADFCGHRILPDSRLCCLYLFEHDYLDDNLIRLARQRGNRLRLVWTATGGFADDGGRVDVKIEARVDFLGITTESPDQEEARKILLANFDLRDFHYVAPAGERVGFFAPLPGKW